MISLDTDRNCFVFFQYLSTYYAKESVFESLLFLKVIVSSSPNLICFNVYLCLFGLVSNFVVNCSTFFAVQGSKLLVNLNVRFEVVRQMR